jgi:translocation and assembly module TamB
MHALRLVLGSLLGLVLVVGALLGGLAWLLRTDDGLDWLLARVPGLEVRGLTGRLDGGPMHADRLVWQSETLRVTVHDLSWRDAQFTLRPHEGAWLGVELVEPAARAVEVQRLGEPAPSGAEPAPPQQIELPVDLRLRDLRVGRLDIENAPPVTDLHLDAHVGRAATPAHVISALSLTTPQARLKGSASIGSRQPLPLDGRIEAAAPADAALPWQATVQVGGTLQRPTLDGTLRAADAGAQVQAVLQPFAPWPLESLRAALQDLDLSALKAGLPQTKLAGRVVVEGGRRDAPLQATIALDNATPGRWSQGRLPVSALNAVVQGRPQQPDVVELERFDAELAGPQPGGRVTGSGRWQGHALDLQFTLAALRPDRLDGRAPAMTLGGPLTLALQGVPSPDRTAKATAPPLSGSVQGRLDGRLAQRGTPPVQAQLELAFEAPPDALRVDLSRFAARAGDGRATLAATLAHSAGQPWTLKSDGELQRFDPAVWWPGGADWRGGNAINAAWRADVALPADAFGQALAAQLRALRGEAALTLRDSRLAAVPLSGRATLRGDGRALQVDAALDAERNRLALDGRIVPGAGSGRWQATIDAPALGALAPLAGLAPGAVGEFWPRSGSARGTARIEGRGAALTSEGELHVAGVGGGKLQIGGADARWSIAGLKADAPLSLQVDAQGLAFGERRLDTLRAELDGSVRDHRLQVRAASPLRPPAWTDPLLGPPAPQGTALVLRAGGGFTPGAGAGGTWRGTLDELRVHARAGEPPAPWLAASGVGLEAHVGEDGGLRTISVAPGRLQLLDAALRWTQASWQAAPTPRIELEAELEPLRVAPLMRKLQPDFGWGGDLALHGSFSIHSAGEFGADLVLERAGGDLSVTDEAGTTTLGLTDLRLGLTAHQGTWHVTQALAGANVGVLGGAQTVRVDPQATFPAPGSPLQGVLEWRVPNLGIWAPWLPPGWRLGGRLRTSASLAGSLGAPEYSGEIVGSELSVRNLFEGVNLKDGELAVRLRGEDATVDRFVFRAGEGTLRIDGGATFGATPRAELTATADRFQAVGRVDRRVVISGTTRLALRGKEASVTGRVAVDSGMIDVGSAEAPKLDADVVVLREGGAPSAQPAQTVAQGSALGRVSVDLFVELGRELRLRGRGLDTLLAGELHITSPGEQLVVEGTVRTAEGTFAAYGEKLEIERGALTFTGRVNDPRMDIIAVRPNLDVRVGVAVSGRVTNPRVRLFSEPEMPEFDKISWLVLGRGPTGLGRDDTALLQRAALALISGQGGGGGPPGGALLKNIGLDDLSVRRSEDGDATDTIITLGKQLSQRWYVGYERGIAATTGTWQLIYRVAQRFRLRAQAGEENAIDIVRSWRWN